ncbi:condensation domain-containing protein [Streptomyces sp. NPDC046985]|uniref:condensation domain-containing protein n=1 Tax=Streptomyces sp. NPDC046985 TaxID=3155377 RepID=UPI0033D2040D
MGAEDRKPVGTSADRIPLSCNQEFLYGYDRGDDEGPFGPRFHIVHGWWLRGKAHPDTLRKALDDVVARHEALRTVVVRGASGEWHQEVRPPMRARLEVREASAADDGARERAAQALLTEVESGTISAHRLPLIKATLVRFDEEHAVLALIVHHSAADGWSVRRIVRDLALCYAARRGHAVPEPPPAPPYRDFVAWQRAFTAGDDAARARAFWRERLAGARIVSVPTDRPKSAGLPESTAVYRFTLDAPVVSRAAELARSMRCTPFMVLMGAFALMIQRTTGSTDTVVPTFSPGRLQDEFRHTVGPFLNLLPLRTELAGCRSFRDVVSRVRATCLAAYSHDIPFVHILAQEPELMRPVTEDDRAACVFQVFPFPFVLDGEEIGDLVFTEIRRRLDSQPVGSDVPNGALWTLNLDPAGDVVAGVQYNSNLYDMSSVAGMVEEYRAVLGEAVAAPDAPVGLDEPRTS